MASGLHTFYFFLKWTRLPTSGLPSMFVLATRPPVLHFSAVLRFAPWLILSSCTSLSTLAFHRPPSAFSLDPHSFSLALLYISAHSSLARSVLCLKPCSWVPPKLANYILSVQRSLLLFYREEHVYSENHAYMSSSLSVQTPGAGRSP